MSEKICAYLLLEDGTLYEGESFGCEGKAIGQIEFNTGITGCQELLTDEKYRGKLLLMTFPLVGNYGLNDEDYSGDRVFAAGYIVREWCREPSNFRSKYTLDEFLKKHKTVGICDIDTRSLTKRIRKTGKMLGMIIGSEKENVIENKEKLLKELIAYGEKNGNNEESVSQKKNADFKDGGVK